MKRTGFTLTELIAVIAVLAVVMGTTVVMLVQLFDFTQHYEEYSQQSRHVDRLVAVFRSDVHTYGKPESPADGALLRWKTETETVDYVLEPGEFPGQQAIVRTVQKGGQSTSRETYRLPDRTTLWCVEGKEAATGLVALSLWTTPQGTEPPKIDGLNPFDRTMANSLQQQINPKDAANWRTIIARFL